MKKLIIIALSSILVLILVYGFSQYEGYTHKKASTAINTPVQSDNYTTTLLATEPPKDRTWISPGKVNIGNFYPGATAEWKISVHNGNMKPVSFSVNYRNPDYTADGFSMPPYQADDWVIISEENPVIMPLETKDILITLDIPKSARNIPDKWEYWISVMDNSQTGIVNTELCSRWLVDMR